MRFGAAVLAIVLSGPACLQAQPQSEPEWLSCRGYLDAARFLIKPHVEALRFVEREAADRLRGLDTRSFLYLAGEARKAVDMIGYPQALKAEEALEQCPNAVFSVRATCQGAALALAVTIEEQEKGAATKESRQAYAEAMPRCEQLIGLPPLSTAWRTIN